MLVIQSKSFRPSFQATAMGCWRRLKRPVWLWCHPASWERLGCLAGQCCMPAKHQSGAVGLEHPGCSMARWCPGQACLGSLTSTVVMLSPSWTKVMGLGDQAPPTTYRVVPVGFSTRADASWEPEPCSADHQLSCRPAWPGISVLSSESRTVSLAGRCVQASRALRFVGGLHVLLPHFDSSLAMLTTQGVRQQKARGMQTHG